MNSSHSVFNIGLITTYNIKSCPGDIPAVRPAVMFEQTTSTDPGYQLLIMISPPDEGWAWRLIPQVSLCKHLLQINMM